MKDEVLEGVKANEEGILEALRRMNIFDAFASDIVMIEAEQELPLHKNLKFIRDQIIAAHADLSNEGKALDLIHK